MQISDRVQSKQGNENTFVLLENRIQSGAEGVEAVCLKIHTSELYQSLSPYVNPYSHSPGTLFVLFHGFALTQLLLEGLIQRLASLSHDFELRNNRDWENW